MTEVDLSYRARPRRTWLDELEAAEERLRRAEERFEEKEEQIRELARERGCQELPKLLSKADPLFASRGFFAEDAKPLFDPIDFVIFAGMNRSASVARVVLFDPPPLSRAREAVQRSIKRAVHAGNYQWKTVRMGKDGQIKASKQAFCLSG